MAAVALIGLALMFGVMVLAGGLRWNDVRELLLHDAYRSFTFDGERIAGLRPGVWARLTIRCLSEPDDGRLVLAPEVRVREPRRLPAFDRFARGIDRELATLAIFRSRSR